MPKIDFQNRKCCQNCGNLGVKSTKIDDSGFFVWTCLALKKLQNSPKDYMMALMGHDKCRFYTMSHYCNKELAVCLEEYKLEE